MKCAVDAVLGDYGCIGSYINCNGVSPGPGQPGSRATTATYNCFEYQLRGIIRHAAGARAEICDQEVVDIPGGDVTAGHHSQVFNSSNYLFL